MIEKARNFQVLSFRDLAELECEGRSWPDRALIITFDDGYRDNFSNAFPILKQLGLPATVFLAAAHIGAAKLFWWDEIAYLIKRTRRTSIALPEVSAEPLQLAAELDKQGAIGRILTWIKQVPEEVKADFLKELPARVEVRIDDSLAAGMHLSWAEVKEMADAGIEFGSHTLTHPVLANVGAIQLEREISESKKLIEQHLAREAVAFAYPVGGKLQYNRSVQDAVARGGYHYAASYEEGNVAATAFERYALRRIHVERDHTLNLFRFNLMFVGAMRRNASPDLAASDAVFPDPVRREALRVSPRRGL